MGNIAFRATSYKSGLLSSAEVAIPIADLLDFLPALPVTVVPSELVVAPCIGCGHTAESIYLKLESIPSFELLVLIIGSNI